MCFIDLEKAFDRVPGQKLFQVLSDYVIEAITGIYIGNKAAVRIDGEMSEAFEVEEGVRQGCCLSPLLLIIFMDKIIRQASTDGNIEVGGVIMKILAYADDLNLLRDNVEDLQRGIDSLNVACDEFG